MPSILWFTPSTATVVRIQPTDGIVLKRAPGFYTDRDQDGLPDFWERQHFNSFTGATAGADGDSDRQSNLDEWIAGTEPTNGQSFFQSLEIAAKEVPTIGTVIRWSSVSDRVYSVESSLDLCRSDAWTTLAVSVPAMNTCTDTVHAGATSQFYRLNVRRP